jgi:class 3 adenylate cyclase
MGNSSSSRLHFNKNAYLALGFFFIFCLGVYCQNQTLADSLESVYTQGNYEKHDKLKILNALAVNFTDTEKKFSFSEELIQTARAWDSINYLFNGFLEKGNALRLKSDLNKAMESYLEAAKIAVEEKIEPARLGTINIAIADVYSIMGNHNNAINYYQNAIAILREENDSLGIASALLNTGDEYFVRNKLDSALIFFKESGEIFKAIKHERGIAYNLGAVGLVYAQKGENKVAEEDINKAIEILDELGDYAPICEYLTYMSDIYLEKGDELIAMDFALRSLNLAQQYGLKKEISDANLKLSELYEQAGNQGESNKFYRNHIVYRDSVNNIEKVREMANLRADFEVSQAKNEVDLLQKESEIQLLKDKRQRIIIYATVLALILIFVLLFFLFRRYSFVKETNTIIEEERNRSDALLLNILPKETAQELKEYGKVQAKKFESVTVLFTDFKDFTRYSTTLTPENLVRSVDYYFSKFDEIFRKHGLEKIKTIGDAYMCVGGLHYHKDHALKMVLAALEINEFVVDSKKLSSKNETRFDMRIGINTGAVVAGVVGIEKFAYDIWGDTVNVASRMQSNSAPGKINISENTYELIKDTFDCEYRGEIEVKNKGMMKMYYVNDIKDKTN